MHVLGAVSPAAPAAVNLVKMPAEKARVTAGKLALYSLLPGAAAGVLGALVWKKHRVLGFLGASAVGVSVYPMVRGSGPTRLAVGCYVGEVGASVAGSLMWKKHPILGYLGGGLVGSVATIPILVGVSK